MKDLRGYLMVMGAATLWGISATAAKSFLNQNVSTLLIVQTRVTFSCLLMALFFGVFRRDVLRVRLSELWRFALLGVLGVAGANFTYYFTIKESTVATGIIIQYTAPLLVMAYASVSGEERVTLVKLTAALISLLGCYLAVGGYDLTVLKLTPVGLASGIGSIVCFAFLSIYTRHLLVRHSVWTVTFYAILFASLFWLALQPPWIVASQNIASDLWVALFGLAIASVLVPHTLYFAGLQYVVPTRAIITSTLEPVVAIGSAALILGELLEPLQVVGAFLVLTAIVLLQVYREPSPVTETSGKDHDATK